MILGDGIRDSLQQHRFSGAWRGNNQTALALANGHHEVHYASGQIVGSGFQLDTLVRVERCQVVEEDLVPSDVRMLEVDGLDLDQSKIALAILWGTNLSRNRIAGVQVKLANLGR